jgi:peroxiredoxin
MQTTNNNKYPFFDLLEVVADPDLNFRKLKSLHPVKAGNIVPEFKLSNDYSCWQQFYNGAETHGHISQRNLLSKPLVISFYSRHWGQQGLAQLKQLNNLQHEVKASGGNLLIISDERTEELEKWAWEQSLTLNFYHDTDKEIAQQFRVYSDDYPVWDRFSGIDENAPLLATYIIEPSKQVIYSHIDWDFLGTFAGEEIISAVYESALISNSRKSA